MLRNVKEEVEYVATLVKCWAHAIPIYGSMQMRIYPYQETLQMISWILFRKKYKCIGVNVQKYLSSRTIDQLLLNDHR
jgi:hypothetical protein